jgi:hypothetical protein
MFQAYPGVTLIGIFCVWKTTGSEAIELNNCLVLPCTIKFERKFWPYSSTVTMIADFAPHPLFAWIRDLDHLDAGFLEPSFIFLHQPLAPRCFADCQELGYAAAAPLAAIVCGYPA